MASAAKPKQKRVVLTIKEEVEILKLNVVSCRWKGPLILSLSSAFTAQVIPPCTC